MKKILLTSTLILAIAIITYLGISYIFEPMCFKVMGVSMFPTLMNGDACLVYNRSWGSMVDVEKDDIIIFTLRGEKFLIKRVVGVPGDNIEVRDGRLYVNQIMESRPFLLLNKTDGYIEATLEPNKYFVMGDNRHDSHDSRNFGTIDRQQIKGVVLIRWRSLTVH